MRVNIVVSMLLAIGMSLVAACQGQTQTGTAPAVTTGVASSSPTPAAKAASPAASPAAAPKIASPTTATKVASPSPAASPVRAGSPVAAGSPSPTSCEFVLGFAELRNELGASRVGQCLESAREIPGNGNTEQRTTNGTLVFRALDNRLLFVTSDRTWIQGPEGVVDRPNDQRFPWEGDRQLVEALRTGGHIIYVRHGATDRNQQDSDPNNLANCATQRNLTEEGRDQARALGEAFQALRIPVGRVLSSEYCRALEYASLAFNQAEVEPSLVLPDPLPQAQRDQNTTALQRLLAVPPPSGTNTVMVSHSPNIRDAAGVDLPAEGGVAILKPEPQGEPTLVARVLPEEWTTWAAALGSP